MLCKKVIISMRPLTELIKHIKNASYILVAGHVSPDGDAIGACTAMGLILEKMGKQYDILLEDPGEQYNYLLSTVNVLLEAPERTCDLFIALDCADFSRLGPFKDAFEKATISWNVDHHVSNTNYDSVDRRASCRERV